MSSLKCNTTQGNSDSSRMEEYSGITLLARTALDIFHIVLSSTLRLFNKPIGIIGISADMLIILCYLYLFRRCLKVPILLRYPFLNPLEENRLWNNSVCL